MDETRVFIGSASVILNLFFPFGVNLAFASIAREFRFIKGVDENL